MFVSPLVPPLKQPTRGTLVKSRRAAHRDVVLQLQCFQKTANAVPKKRDPPYVKLPWGFGHIVRLNEPGQQALDQGGGG